MARTSDAGTLRVDNQGHLVDLSSIVSALEALYPDSDLGNKADPLDELVFILLSVKTPEHRYEQAYERVKRRVKQWRELPDIDERDLQQAIGDAGLSRVKARILKGIAQQLVTETGDVSLDVLHTMTDDQIEQSLTALPGVGSKVAKCVMLFSFGRAVFPVDTHCFRVGTRLGWFPANMAKTARNFHQVETAIPEELRRSLHVRLVQHGRAVCQPRLPKCGRCPLRPSCRFWHETRHG